jgi:hypothetical protein
MSSDAPSRTAPVENHVDRPWAGLTTDQLLDRIEWSYSESETFEPEVVWELARRASERGTNLEA